MKGSGVACKSRPVQRGFERREYGEIQMDSPTANRASVRLFATIVSNHPEEERWAIGAWDVRHAFLQSDEYAEDDPRRVAVCPPPFVVLPWKGSLEIE